MNFEGLKINRAPANIIKPLYLIKNHKNMFVHAKVRKFFDPSYPFRAVSGKGENLTN